MRRLYVIIMLLASTIGAQPPVQPQQRIDPVWPWQDPCIVVDSTFPYVHLVDCPTPPPDPPATPVSNPNPKGCQDCIAQ